MNKLLELIAKFFGHIEVTGVEAMAIKTIQAIVVLLAVYVISKMLQRCIVRKMKSNGIDNKEAVRVYNQYLHVFLMTIGFLLALHVLGINLATFFHTGGLIAIAAAFALKNLAENMVSGMILKIERIIKPGDILETKDTMMKVVKIGFRATVAETKDAKNILIPNAEIIQDRITNYTYTNSLCGVWTTVGVSYSSDLRQVRSILEGICDKLNVSSEYKTLEVMLLGFGDSTVNFRASAWIADPWQSGRIKSELNEAIWWAFKDAGIKIAFPQLDVHLDDDATKHQTFYTTTKQKNTK
jgi:small-conductance mechanosensitive channel